MADLRGREGPKFFQFHAVFRKIWQNHKLASLPGELAPPPRGNPGSATAVADVTRSMDGANQQISRKHQTIYLWIFVKLNNFTILVVTVLHFGATNTSCFIHLEISCISNQTIFGSFLVLQLQINLFTTSKFLHYVLMYGKPSLFLIFTGIRETQLTSNYLSAKHTHCEHAQVHGLWGGLCCYHV